MIGIDGCPGGWVTVAWQGDDFGAYVHPSIESLWRAYPAAERMLIDMPIGLPDEGERPPEAEARRILGARRSSVFAVPVRDALSADSYVQASAINERITGKKLSKQTWNIMPKMREVDAFMRGQTSAQGILLESHPEVVFRAFAGEPLLFPKKHSLGFLERLNLLRPYYPEAESFIRGAYLRLRQWAAVDDIVDALALAVAAQTDDLKHLPENPSYDRYGLPMQIVYPG